MRYLSLVASITILLTSCAEYFGNVTRISTVDLQVPSQTQAGVTADTERVRDIIRAIAHLHGLVEQEPEQANGNTLYAGIPGYSGGQWTGQPDVDWNAGVTWKEEIARRHDLPDSITLTLFPPKTGNVLKIDMWVSYASQMPAQARPVWEDILAELKNEYGSSAIIKVDELK